LFYPSVGAFAIGVCSATLLFSVTPDVYDTGPPDDFPFNIKEGLTNDVGFDYGIDGAGGFSSGFFSSSTVGCYC